jgi:aarF domain-containing kinase
MLDKHVESILALGEPLRHEGVFDFGSQDITAKIYRTIPLMLKNRLKSPPEEVYSLHRKLSGAYLACIRMRARVDCRTIFQQLKPAYRIESLL